MNENLVIIVLSSLYLTAIFYMAKRFSDILRNIFGIKTFIVCMIIQIVNVIQYPIEILTTWNYHISPFANFLFTSIIFISISITFGFLIGIISFIIKKIILKNK